VIYILPRNAIIGLALIGSCATAQVKDYRIYSASSGEQNELGSIISMNADGSDFKTIKNFYPNPNGMFPSGGLLKASDGHTYGMMGEGGNYGYGTIFKLSLDGSEFIKILDFNGSNGAFPLHSGLIEASDGNLYGVTSRGGTYNYGVIFRVDFAGNYSVIYNFGGFLSSISPIGNLIQASDGNLYGVTGGSGHIYKVSINGTGYANILKFDGTMKGKDAVGIIEGINGEIVATTVSGGVQGNGVIIKVNKDGTGFAKFHDFNIFLAGRSAEGVLLEHNGKYYGLTKSLDGGKMFRIDADGMNFTVLHTFDSYGIPMGTLGKLPSGEFYGTNEAGGVFTIKPDGTDFNLILYLRTVQSFSLFSRQRLLWHDNKFFGVVNRGAASAAGSIFNLTLDGTFTSIKEFPFEGSYPAGVIKGSNGKIYGGLNFGGTYGTGSIFMINDDGTDYENIVEFDNGISSNFSSLKEYESALFAFGAKDNKEVIFSVGLDGTGLTILHEFQVNQAFAAIGQLVIGQNGLIYGTTQFTNSSDLNGTIYSIEPDGDNFTVMYSFDGISGRNPSWLISTLDGYLCGVSEKSPGQWQVFRMKENGTEFSSIVNYNASLNLPRFGDKLIHASNGYVYGTSAFGGPDGNGAIYRFLPDGTDFSLIHSFNLSDGRHLTSGIVEATDGHLYGLASAGGLGGVSSFDGRGTSFRLASDGSQFQKLFDFSSNTTSHPIGDIILIEKEDQNGFSFDPIPPKTFGDPGFEVTAISDFPVYFESLNNIAIVSGNKVYVNRPGEAIIRAYNEGDEKNKPAEDFQSFSVSRRAQIIYVQINDRTLGEGSFDISAESTSGLPLLFSSISDKIMLNGNQVQILKPGRVEIVISQQGDEYFLPAKDTTRFCVNPEKPNLTLSTSGSPILTSSESSNYQWFRDGNRIAGANKQEFTATADGIYQVQVNVDDCLSEISDELKVKLSPSVVTGDLRDPLGGSIVFPNPAGDLLSIALDQFSGEIDIVIVDHMGRVLGETSSNGGTLLVIPFQDYPPGIYFLLIKQFHKEHRWKVLKKY